ncbi:MAG: hypothetical protein AB4372_00380 [Xenococcus sp. (in: cyanobacteria)]
MKVIYSILFLLNFLNFSTATSIGAPIKTPPKNNANNPVEITIAIDINKIYNIDNINETYTIDGYLTTTWLDKRLAFDSNTQEREIILLENDSLADEVRENIWLPTLQFINTVEAPEIPNRALIIRKDGFVVYVERFTGSFTSYMDFRKYPFDTQEFKVEVESFSYNIQDVIFVEPQFREEMTEKAGFDQWNIIEEKTFVSEYQHSFLENLFGDSKNIHSRYNAVIIAQRNPHYFIWQIFIPLMVLMISSFTVLYDKDMSNQWAIAFTLLLTVVAFNFYVSEHIPKLPYNVFIEAIITSGYLLIFIEIIAILIQHLLIRKGQERKANNFIDICRWAFPLSYFLFLIILRIIFFDPEIFSIFFSTNKNLNFAEIEEIENHRQFNTLIYDL